MAHAHRESIAREYQPIVDLTCIYLNRHLKEGGEPFTRAALYPSLFGGETGEPSPEVSAFFEHIAVAKLEGRRKSMENKAHEPQIG